MDDRRYWFGPKPYGYGVSPRTWKGWALTFGLVALEVLFGSLLPQRVGPGGTILGCVGLAALFFWIAFRTSSPESWKWRWGERE